MAKKARKKSMGKVDFTAAFKYPFNRPKGLFNILWVLLPVIGWFALIGYAIRIVREFAKGNFKELPIFNFSKNLELGFFMFFKFIPLLLAIFAVNFVLGLIPVVGILAVLALGFFVVPMLVINFFVKGTIESSFDISKVHAVFDNFEDYIVVVLKSIGLQLVFLLMFLILIGIPAQSFTKNIFFADFYRRNVK